MVTKAMSNKKLLTLVNQKLCSADLLLKYCKNINDWPDGWAIEEVDIEIGKGIVKQFKLFLIEKIEQGRAKKTIKTHAGYLWALGGELISQLNEDETERHLSASELILKYID